MARVGRTVARLALLATGGLIAWSVVSWYRGAGLSETKGACPAIAVDYVNEFPKFEAKLREQRAAASGWTNFRKEMEAIQNRSSIELCRVNLDRMKKVEAEIPLAEGCPAADAAPDAKAVASNQEATQLMHFRDCSDAKARELSALAKQRGSRGEETGQLHSLIKEVTKITTDSITLVTQFREQADEMKQTKCWLRRRISDCGR